MNHLASSTSPYLLQHASNPVDWYPWGREALDKARAEDKPIFLSIGYMACHWCHVMAHESFEDPETAALMNTHFINIKVDREERPDLDALYMQAVIALNGSGGWPMSVFLTPDLQPFYGGTYFPPQPAHGLPSFRQVLTALAEAWRTQRAAITNLGTQLTEQMRARARLESNQPFPYNMLEDAGIALLQNYDRANGGWGMPPKFPQPMTIEFLLHLLPSLGDEGLKTVRHCLNSMARGGMYDVVGGGFHRYSTDARWLVPHFEKMLYDNALLARAYLHTWQISREPAYRRVWAETLDFVAREMTHPEGGFYSSLDADSDGEEGKFYTWTVDEIRQTLGETAAFFEAAYNIQAHGNWEGKIILQRRLDDESLARRFHLDPQVVPVKLADCHTRLLTARAQRPRPATDDKIVTAWNGLMLSAFAEAARVDRDRRDSNVENEHQNLYLNLATRNAHFLLTALRPNGQLRRTWRQGQVGGPAFLEDYAALILGLLELYQTDFNPRWFAAAQELADEMTSRFNDPAGGFFDTPADVDHLLVRPKEIQDNATPSGNALAIEALLKLSAFSEHQVWRDMAEHALGIVAQAAIRYPLAFAHWLSAACFARGPVRQIALVGDMNHPEMQSMLAEIRAAYRPNVVVAAAAYPPPAGSPALLNDRRPPDGRPTAYVCEGFVCRQPVSTTEELRDLLAD